MATILVVDDEPDICSLLTDLLTPEGHIVHTTANGSDALHMVQSKAFDLALVDIWLPGMSGVELLKHLKYLAPEMPVVIITSRPAYETAVQALQGGACDYVEKPFALDNLRATIQKTLEKHCLATQIRVGGLVINLAKRQVWQGERTLALTPTEFEVLTCLTQQAGRVVTFHELLTKVWHHRSGLGSKEQVRTVVWRLRSKIERDPAHPCLLVTVRGMGYRLETQSDESGVP